MGKFCGCVNNCVPIEISKINNAKSPKLRREYLRPNLHKVPIPYSYEIKRLITFVLKEMDICSQLAKVIVIHALVLIERIIDRS